MKSWEVNSVPFQLDFDWNSWMLFLWDSGRYSLTISTKSDTPRPALLAKESTIFGRIILCSLVITTLDWIYSSFADCSSSKTLLDVYKRTWESYNQVQLRFSVSCQNKMIFLFCCQIPKEEVNNKMKVYTCSSTNTNSQIITEGPEVYRRIGMASCAKSK